MAPDSLRLLRPRKGNILSFTLDYYPFDQAPHYIALSYTWRTDDYSFAPSETQHQIKVNGLEFDVHENLFDALEHTWADVQQRKCLLWVDSICVNQSSLVERATQVEAVGKIFESAEAIFAWLGLPLFHQETEYALVLMHSFDEELESSLREHGGYLSSENVRRQNMQAMQFFPNDKQPGTTAAWKGLAHLFSRALWRRTWIQQELNTRKPTICYCGDLVFPLFQVVPLVYRAMMHEEHPNFDARFSERLGNRSYIGKLMLLRQRRHGLVGKGREGRWSLIELMGLMRSTQCSDARDKVFAPLSLATDELAKDIDKRYDVPVATLYTQVARRALVRGRSLALLGLVHHSKALAEVGETLPGLPSWVPDWRYPAPNIPSAPRIR